MRRALAAALLALVLVFAAPATAALAQAGAPDTQGATDLRSDKLALPREDDSRPGGLVGAPLALGAVAVFGVAVVAVVRSRRAHVGDQLRDGSAGR